MSPQRGQPRLGDVAARILEVSDLSSDFTPTAGYTDQPSSPLLWRRFSLLPLDSSPLFGH